jgi:hypothetical protein
MGSTVVGLLLIVAVLLAVATAGCDDSQSATGQPTPTAEAILAQALTSSNISSGTGEFDASIVIDADTTTLPSDAQAVLDQPVALSGTYSFNDDPVAFEAAMNLSIAGQSIPLGIKAVDNQAWIQILGEWYETPAHAADTGSTTTSIGQADINALLQALAAAGVNPTTWITGLSVAGEENIDGAATYHLTGTVDVNQIVADVIKLMQDPNFQNLLPSLGGLDKAGSGPQGPTEQELQELQSQITAWIKNFPVDMWIAKDTYQFRQVEVSMSIVPPAGEGEGLNSIDIKARVSVAPASTPVTVTPPPDARPFSDLEQVLGTLQGLFEGATGGLPIGPSTTGTTTP